MGRVWLCACVRVCVTLTCQTAHAMNQWGEVWVALSLITQSLPSSFYHFFLPFLFSLFFLLLTESIFPCLVRLHPPLSLYFIPQLSKRCESVEVCARSLVAFLHFLLFDISSVKRLLNLKVKLIHTPIVCLFVLEISERGLNT